MKTTQKKLAKSQIEIEFELTADEFKEHAAHAVEHLKHHIKVDGFRPGKAPASMVEDKIKPEALLMEAGDHAVRHVYSEYVLENKLEPVGQPEVSIIKIAQGSPFVFKAIITVLPDVELPDYKEISSKIKGKEISVSEEEIQDSLNYLQKTRAKMTPKSGVAASGQAEKGDFVQIEYENKTINAGAPIKDQFILGEAGFVKGFEENIFGMKSGEEKSFKLEGKDGEFKVKMVSVQKMELPEINDEFAKQLGAFDTLVALKTSMKEGILLEKTEAEKQRKRGEILEKIAEKSKLEMPESMVEYEKERLLENLKNRIAEASGISFEDYLASVKKTEKELKETFQKEAEKRLRGFLVLREISRIEKLEVSEKEIEEEMAKSNFKNVDIEQLKEYTKGVIINEKIFKILECQ